MSGVTGVLLSYGGSGYVPPWTPTFTMTNVDNIVFSVATVPNFSALLAEVTYAGDVGFPSPSGTIGSDSYYVDPQTSPIIDYTNYDDVDWGSSTRMWEEALDIGSSRYPINGAVIFDNLVAEYPTQTIFSGYIVCKWSTSYGIPSPSTYTLNIAPYTGGVIERQAYASLVLINSGGVAGTSVNVNGDYQYYEVDGNGFIDYTQVNYIYHVATKTLYLEITTETKPS